MKVELSKREWSLVMGHLKAVCLFSGKRELMKVYDKMVNQMMEEFIGLSEEDWDELLKSCETLKQS